jgi:hypothetical protein
MLLKKLIEKFKAKKIDYALIGGYAVALHGAVRGTVDIDIAISLQESIKVENVMTELGLVSKIPVSASEIAAFRLEFIENRNLKVWSFVNPSNPIDLVDLMLTHDLKELKIVRKETTFGTINIVSIDDLIKLKREAARPQDIADIEALERIKNDAKQK